MISTTNNRPRKYKRDKRNPPPLTVSCAPSGDEGPTSYIEIKENKKQPTETDKIKPETS
jgi:hypothetical protein